jgi:hypothetical protein
LKNYEDAKRIAVVNRLEVTKGSQQLVFLTALPD